jgi:hypothetical protein
MDLRSTPSLTEMRARNLPGGKGWLTRKADNLTVICEPTVYKTWEPRRLTNVWASMACYKDGFGSFVISMQTIWCRTVRLMNDELERIWKEVVAN